MSIALGSVFTVALALAVGGLGATAAAADGPSWSPADAFGASPPANPGPDRYGHPATWEFLQGIGLDPSTYHLLTAYNGSSCGLAGNTSFSDPAGLPSVDYNGTGAALVNVRGTCSSTFTIPNHGIAVHPYSTDVILQWTAPADGTIGVGGTLSDADVNGGNGIAWTVARYFPGPGATEKVIATDSFPNGGSSDLSLYPDLARINVLKGMKIVLLVNDNGNPDYDLTNVDLTLSQGPALQPLPNLDGGTFYRSFQGPGNVNGLEECTNAFNVVDGSGRGFTLSAKHCTDGNLDADDQRTNANVAAHQPMTLTTSTDADVSGALRIATGLDCSPPSSPIQPKNRAPISTGGGRCILPSDNPVPTNGDMYAFTPDAPTTLSSMVQTARGLQPVLGEETVQTVLQKGEQVCHYGAGSAHLQPSTPEHCGYLWSGTADSYGDYSIATLGVKGDSGGPAYVYKYNAKGKLRGVTAVGMVIRIRSLCSLPGVCQPGTDFIPIKTILNRLGVELK